MSRSRISAVTSIIIIIIIVRGTVFSRKVRIINISNNRGVPGGERGITSILDLFGGSDLSKTIRRKAKKVPTASHRQDEWGFHIHNKCC